MSIDDIVKMQILFQWQGLVFCAFNKLLDDVNAVNMNLSLRNEDLEQILAQSSPLIFVGLMNFFIQQTYYGSITSAF